MLIKMFIHLYSLFKEFYTHLIYTDRYKGSDKYMSKDILLATFWIIKYFGGDGAVLWASSTRFQTAEDCERLQVKILSKASKSSFFK